MGRNREAVWSERTRKGVSDGERIHQDTTAKGSHGGQGERDTHEKEF